ncbi:hypothetical protein ACUH97_08040 [Dermabacteraceae bacterium P13088]
MSDKKPAPVTVDDAVNDLLIFAAKGGPGDGLRLSVEEMGRLGGAALRFAAKLIDQERRYYAFQEETSGVFDPDVEEARLRLCESPHEWLEEQAQKWEEGEW